MLQSAGVRFIIVGVLALLMFIPLGLVSDIIQDIYDRTNKQYGTNEQPNQ